jgi:quercetin dioxygenase-like cupin family protein
VPGDEAPIALGPGEGERIRNSTIKADRPELALFEFEIPPGGGADLHFHREHSDSFLVLEGELEFRVGEETIRATPGTCVHHGFRNVSERPARALNLHTPGGFARYWRELNEIRAAGDEPPDGFFERHDVYDVEELDADID